MTRAAIVCCLALSCAPAALEVEAGDVASPDASSQPISGPPEALASDYDPAQHLPGAPAPEPHHQHHHAPDAAPAASGEPDP